MAKIYLKRIKNGDCTKCYFYKTKGNCYKVDCEDGSIYKKITRRTAEKLLNNGWRTL
jgi:hypothetical protein